MANKDLDRTMQLALLKKMLAVLKLETNNTIEKCNGKSPHDIAKDANDQEVLDMLTSAGINN